MLSSTPLGIADPWITIGPGPPVLAGQGGCPPVICGLRCGSTTTWPTPGDGWSAVRQNLPAVTRAGMPWSARAWRTAFFRRGLRWQD
jgi:hypothetical protein